MSPVPPEERAAFRAPVGSSLARRSPFPRVYASAAAFLWTASLTGCMALGLAGRGVPGPVYMRSYTIEMAPIDVPDGGGHHGGQQPPPLQLTSPFTGWVHGYSWDLVDAAGQPVPEEVLHHFKLTAPNRRELFNAQMLRIAGAGSETEPVSLPKQVGYRIHRGDPLLLTAMVHNPGGVELHGVRLRVHLRYSPPGEWRNPESAYPFFTQITEPGAASSFDLPAGRSEHRLTITPAVSGRLLGLGGHLHRYGIELRLEDAATAALIWRTVSERDSTGDVSRVPSELLVHRGGIPLEGGHAYRFVAVYDNPTGEVIEDGGMATLGGLFLADADWPEADPSDPVYRWDLARETAGTAAVSHDHGADDGSGDP